MSPEPTKQPDLIKLATQVVRLHDRVAILQSLSELHAPEAGASFVHRWLWAECHYRSARFPEAFSEFRSLSTQVWPDLAVTPSPGLPVWLLARADLRCAYIGFRLGDGEAAEQHLKRCRRLGETNVGLDELEPDCESVASHLAELEGSIELSRARFLRAHHMSKSRGHMARAATTASDIGRLLADLGRLAEGYEWQQLALDLMGRHSDEVSRRMVIVRIAKLEMAMRCHAEAEARLDDLMAASKDGLVPEAEIRASIALAELAAISDESTEGFKAALSHLAHAQTIAERSGMKPLGIRVQRELARMHVTSPSPKARAEAPEIFERAVRTAMALKPPPGLLLQQLAEDIRHHPGLVPADRPNRAGYLERLHECYREFRASLRPRLYGYSFRRKRRLIKARELGDLLENAFKSPATPTEMVLQCGDLEVRTYTGSVELHRAGVQIDRGSAYMARIIEKFVKAGRPLSPMDVVQELDTTVDSVGQALSLIRRQVKGVVLRSKREGKTVYTIECRRVS